MDKKLMLEEIKNILETDITITPEMNLSDFDEWGSLAAISIMALYKQKYNIEVEAKKLKLCKTIDDLLRLAE